MYGIQDGFDDFLHEQLCRINTKLAKPTQSERQQRENRRDIMEQMEFEQGFGHYLGHAMGPRRPNLSRRDGDWQ